MQGWKRQFEEAVLNLLEQPLNLLAFQYLRQTADVAEENLR